MSNVSPTPSTVFDPKAFGSEIEAYLAERDAIVHQANTMRAEAMFAMFRALGRGTVAVLKAVTWPVVAIWYALAYARAVEALSDLDDAALERIGVARDDIANHVFAVVYGERKPVLEAIPGGKVPTAPSIETPERRAA